MFRLTIPLLRDEQLDEIDLINKANETLNGTLKSILEEIENNSQVTQNELSSMLDIPLRTVKRYMAFLQENSYIERIGSKKNRLLENTKEGGL